MMKRHVKISLARWCHKYFGPQWSLEDHCKAAKDLGADGIELVPPDQWDTLAKHGLRCPLALLYFGEQPEPDPFVIGWNCKDHHDRVAKETKRLIEAAGKSGGLCSAVIAFSGNAVKGQNALTGVQNCIDGLNTSGVIDAAEKAMVNISFEALNDRVGEAMRGHPGYDATSLDYVSRVVKGVDSPHLGALLDVYHRQVQAGNLRHAIAKYGPITNHVHVAGIGGTAPRAEMNTQPQEVDWTGVSQLIAENTGEDVWVGIEYIPTDGRDYLKDLADAIALIRNAVA